jgi:hypothetical protein
MDVYLRDYNINPGLIPEFLDAWGTRVLPLRERCGFTLLGAWADEASDRFVCVLGYAGPGDIDAADEHYEALPEHQPIAEESSRLVKEAHITRLAAVELRRN